MIGTLLQQTLPLLATSAPEGSHEFAVEHGGPAWIALIPAMPLVACILCAIFAATKVKSQLPSYVSVACLAVSFLVTLFMFLDMPVHDHGQYVVKLFDWIHFQYGPGPEQVFTADIGFYVDRLTCLWMLFVTGLATLICLYAGEYMSHDVGTGYCRFFFAFNLFVLAMTCLVMADNLILLYLGWEGVGLCSYLLIGYFYKKPSAVAAAKKAFIMNRIGDLGLALGVMLIFVHFGTVEYATLFGDHRLHEYVDAATAGHFDQIPLIAQLIPVLLMIGAFGKSAQLPLYVWLPDAMEGPTPVSALIHAATMVTAGIFMICRNYQIFVASEWALPTVAWVGTLTAFLAATIGMAQFDIKRIMAYSTVSQLGYMFAGLGFLTSVGAAYHVFTHAFFKATLFLCCGAVMHGFAGQLDLRKLSGVSFMKGWGIVGIAMLIGCLNLAGFPFTAGFWSKDIIIAEAFVRPGFGIAGWILLLTAGLTAYYTFRVFFRVFVGPKAYEPGDEVHDDQGHDHGHDHGHDDDHAHDAHAHGGAHDFHPHPPGPRINLVLGILAIASLGALAINFMGEHHGWVGDMIHESSAHYETPFHHVEEGAEAHGHHHHREAGSFFGIDPHNGIMYWVSGAIGIVGIAVAFVLHYAGRTRPDETKADAIAAAMGPIPTWAEHKWYVDELYEFLFRRPLKVLSQVFFAIDKLLVDGLVNLAGALPGFLGTAIRPSQSGAIHGYAAGMAGGLVVILLFVILIAGGLA